MKKVSVGTVAARNKTWFPELSDKIKSDTCRYYVIMYMCFYKYICMYIYTYLRIWKKYQNALILVHEELCWKPCRPEGENPQH